ncbi:DUF805 domain-containing protein [Leifsonia poae]|uniref:DUF805 domain-containing protein n=1 Tax=Leifsonia poae TaxID=110933 RepID=UPI003D695140
MALQVTFLVSAPPGGRIDGEGGFDAGPLVALPTMIALAWAFGTLVPGLALVWRRLHDADLSGAFFLLVLVPLVGGLTVLVLTLLPPNARGARFDRRPPGAPGP